ncbi:hypothetical protein H257_01144 [Aphanomyces astaci]|uniref:Preprotein translocase subunit Sec66 n=1 Tax=Aphanomyces astaci TaxID=112090 RepID=W4H7V7_APHAT|nr:hypothetical protein H257_01144 [Aphanomyces astaci]ETV87641.1 hypothetical protein H257_01144 [Aphanomyces astaci]KAF0774712.1 hypothetical protein AaE_001590 [Aphanomyces astaci]RHY19578.1 hypothetical protein DYB25_000044 [Aphanomyces astaci]RHY40032.1 hypothetical protein DYB38_002202 [Aphanomyces astaci]RHY43626.1 hypothetical protein DYB34_001853 [Aphanomyces astaci]|eukprot:XP_009822504.1 hypothetical protein H257_01144 [Aphanomyces astaci]
MVSAVEWVAVGVLVFALFLVYSAVNAMRPKKSAEGDDILEEMINGFDFTLPAQIEEYRALKEKAPEVLTEEDMKTLCSALFRRAVADIPLIRRIQTEAQGMHKLKTNDLIKDGSYMSFKLAEEMIGEEIKEVREEAQALQPQDNWGESIFAQAVQFINHMSEQEELAEQKKRQAEADAQQQAAKQTEMAAQLAADLRKRK